MNGEEFIEYLRANPIVAAIKDEEGLSNCLTSECQVVFILSGNLNDIAETVFRIKRAGKLAMVHVDLIDGLAARDAAVDFIARTTSADGIISTRPGIMRYAKNCGLLTVQRFFVIDSIALNNIIKQPAANAADAIEILPGTMPKIIHKIVMGVGKPVIAGGLITDKEDILGALEAGAIAVSSSNQNTWIM